MSEPFVPLLEDSVDPDPLVQFGRWFEDAASVVASPEAMAVATADADGRPSVRMVLLKAWGRDGFVFHTNYESRKGRELAANPVAALLFYWEPRGRQVRIEGAVERASASHQSEVVDSRAQLDRQVEAVRSEFAGREITRPPWWGGERIRPHSYEFWQNREDRLHDRLRYTPDAGGWRITRLQP